MTAAPTDGHQAEFGMTGTTFTGDSTTLKREAYLASLGLPDERETGELVRRLIKNVVEIKDTTGASGCLLSGLLAGPAGESSDTAERKLAS